MQNFDPVPASVLIVTSTNKKKTNNSLDLMLISFTVSVIAQIKLN